MPSYKLLQSTAVVTARQNELHELLLQFRGHIRAQEPVEAIKLLAWRCFHTDFCARTHMVKRHLLRQMWQYISEFYEKQQAAIAAEQAAFQRTRCTGEPTAQVQAYRENFMADIASEQYFSRNLGACDALVNFMYEDQNMFTESALEMLASRMR